MDIVGNIQGAFNQANQATRAARDEKNRGRKVEEDRVREARRRYILEQEEVAQTQSLHDPRITPDKDPSDGQDARDQYDAHSRMTAQDRPPEAAPLETSPPAPKEPRREPPEDTTNGHLIDIEA